MSELSDKPLTHAQLEPFFASMVLKDGTPISACTLDGIRRYGDWYPPTREEFDLQDRVYRKPDGSRVKLVSGDLPGDAPSEEPMSPTEYFEWLQECPAQIERKFRTISVDEAVPLLRQYRGKIHLLIPSIDDDLEDLEERGVVVA